MHGSNHSFRVYVLKNHNAAVLDRNLHVDVYQKMKFSKFLKLAGKVLNIKHPKRCFITTGSGPLEITQFDELKANDYVTITNGEDFHGNSNGCSSGAGTQESMSFSVLGSGGVGKSACVLRFVRDYFVKNWDPTIEDAYHKTTVVDGRPCTLELLDTAGQEEFETLRHQWMEQKDGYVFVYSIANSDSLDDLRLFYDIHASLNGSKRNQVPIVMVANKKDIGDLDPRQRMVPLCEGIRRAKEFGAIHMEASAATSENINEIFERLVREVRKRSDPRSDKGLSQKCCIL